MQKLSLPASPLLLALLALSGCADSNASETPTDEGRPTGVREREIPKVRVAEVERREMIQELETTSVLESEREIQIFPRMSGVVIEVLAEEADLVTANQVLARLDDRDEVLAMKDAEVAMAERENDASVTKLAVEEALGLLESSRFTAAQRQRDYDRNRQLFEESETKPLSAQELEASRLELDRAQGDEKQAEVTWRRRQLEEQAAAIAAERAKVTYERAALALAHTAVLAPFDGVIAERTVRTGDSVSSGQASFVLTDPDAIRAIFFRPQEELALFTMEQDADDFAQLNFHATTEAFPGREFRGAIERISPTINAQSGQFRVTAGFHPVVDGGPPLLPGMLVRMHIATDRHAEALVVPKRALRREGERRYVLAAEPAGADDDGEFVLREVDVDEGFSNDDFVEVIPAGDELLVGTPVVVVGGRDLAQDDPVDIDYRNGGPQSEENEEDASSEESQS